jgi:DNA-binding GntR family transcriptional regulator
VTRQTARDKAFIHLRKKLVTMQLRPGEIIDIAQQCDELGIGRTPVMEALQMLATYDLIEIHPRSGCQVTQPDIMQARRIYEVREVLEGMAARLAATRAPRSRVTDLLALLEVQRQQKDTQDHTGFLLADQDMHLAVAEMSDNIYLYRALERVLVLNTRLWFMFFEHVVPSEDDLFSHADIVHKIIEKSPGEAELLAREHVNRAKDRLMVLFT